MGKGGIFMEPIVFTTPKADVLGGGAPVQRVVQQQPRPIEKKGGRPNFFNKQKKRFGENWLNNPNVKIGEHDVTSIVIDLIKGNLGPEDILLFYNTNVNMAMTNVIYNNAMLYEYRVRANIAFEQAAGDQIAQCPPIWRQYIDNDKIVLYIWRSMNTYMDYISQLSRMYNKEVIVNYTMNEFMPAVRQCSKFTYLL